MLKKLKPICTLPDAYFVMRTKAKYEWLKSQSWYNKSDNYTEVGKILFVIF